MTAATALYQSSRRVRAIAARSDFGTFCELVLLDEETNRPIQLSEHLHEFFIRILNEYDQAVIFAHIESGKTQIVSIAYTLWCLGRDPTWRVAILSSTKAQAEKVGRALARYIERSKELHAVFPRMRAASPWNTFERSISRPGIQKDASVTCFGLDGPISGFRADLLNRGRSLRHQQLGLRQPAREFGAHVHLRILGPPDCALEVHIHCDALRP